MEAVYLLATTRSFRTTRLGDCLRHGEANFELSGRVAIGHRTDLAFSWSPTVRTRLLNGSPAPLADYLASLPVVPCTVADHELLAGPPRLRRRFLDQGVVGLRPGAIEVFSRYRRALDQKRELLASGGRGLRSWNEVLANAATELIRLRREYVRLLAGVLEAVLGEAGLGLGSVDLRYRSSPNLSDGDGGEQEGTVLEAFERVSGREREVRAPVVGPHRDELEFLWQDRAVRRVASAGERKLFGLGLAAARGRLLAERGREPVFLLDDLDAELDAIHLEKVRSLFSSVGQLLVTSNHEGLWKGWEGLRKWRISGGKTVAV